MKLTNKSKKFSKNKSFIEYIIKINANQFIENADKFFLNSIYFISDFLLNTNKNFNLSWRITITIEKARITYFKANDFFNS
jgi:hypothetical protein